MHLHKFIANTTQEAVDQVREKLGPAAVVLNVRKLGHRGISNIWRQPQVEVLAGTPDADAAPPKRGDSEFAQKLMLSELREEVTVLRDELQTQRDCIARGNTPSPIIRKLPQTIRREWAAKEYLAKVHVTPVHAQKILERMQSLYGRTPPSSLAEEMKILRAILPDILPPKHPPAVNRIGVTHCFVGPTGVGKSTVLCKWLTQATLLHNTPGRVWRLDGSGVNNSGWVDVHAEILGAPLLREIEDTQLNPGEIGFVDLPGIDWRRTDAATALGDTLKRFTNPVVHLVLNAAYDSGLLLAQARALAKIQADDLVFTHLDETSLSGKWINLCLGTELPLGYLSAGQNIPGNFSPASQAVLLKGLFSGV